jgi:hypothetical protein
VPLVIDLCIAHDRFASSSDPSLNGHLHYPNDINKSLNETVTDKIRKYRSDYNKTLPTTVVTVSGVQLAQQDRGLFHFRRTTFSVHLKIRVGLTLAKAAALRIMINIDGAPISSKSHPHPSHSQTSRLYS